MKRTNDPKKVESLTDTPSTKYTERNESRDITHTLSTCQFCTDSESENINKNDKSSFWCDNQKRNNVAMTIMMSQGLFLDTVFNYFDLLLFIRRKQVNEVASANYLLNL